MKTTTKIISASLFSCVVCTAFGIVRGFYLGADAAWKMPIVSGDSQALHLLHEHVCTMREEECSQEKINDFIDNCLTWYEENWKQAYNVIPKRRLVHYLQCTR